MTRAGNFMAGVGEFCADHARRADRILIGNTCWCFEGKLRLSCGKPDHGN